MQKRERLTSTSKNATQAAVANPRSAIFDMEEEEKKVGRSDRTYLWMDVCCLVLSRHGDLMPQTREMKSVGHDYGCRWLSAPMLNVLRRSQSTV